MELLTDRIAIKYGFQIKQVGGELLDGGQLHFLVIDSCQCLGKERSEEEEEEREGEVVERWKGKEGGQGRREQREGRKGRIRGERRERMRGKVKTRNSWTLLYSLASFIPKPSSSWIPLKLSV